MTHNPFDFLAQCRRNSGPAHYYAADEEVIALSRLAGLLRAADGRYYHDDYSTPGGAVFVFGSNLSGIHGAGAARYAAEHCGAWAGAGVGPTGRAYALPTKDHNLQQLPFAEIARHAAEFVAYARAHPDERFFLTRVGCGLAGYHDAEIAPLFRDAPGNCSFPRDWQPYLTPPQPESPA